jgi:hypothetical protein
MLSGAVLDIMSKGCDIYMDRFPPNLSEAMELYFKEFHSLRREFHINK